MINTSNPNPKFWTKKGILDARNYTDARDYMSIWKYKENKNAYETAYKKEKLRMLLINNK